MFLYGFVLLSENNAAFQAISSLGKLGKLALSLTRDAKRAVLSIEKRKKNKSLRIFLESTVNASKVESPEIKCVFPP